MKILTLLVVAGLLAGCAAAPFAAGVATTVTTVAGGVTVANTLAYLVFPAVAFGSLILSDAASSSQAAPATAETSIVLEAFPAASQLAALDQIDQTLLKNAYDPHTRVLFVSILDGTPRWVAVGSSSNPELGYILFRIEAEGGKFIPRFSLEPSGSEVWVRTTYCMQWAVYGVDQPLAGYNSSYEPSPLGIGTCAH